MPTGDACAETGVGACCDGAANTSTAPFAHVYDTGGMRSTHLRGHTNILERRLIQVGGFNLGLVMRHLIGLGTPRGLQGRFSAVIAALLALLADAHAPCVSDLRAGSGVDRSAPLDRLSREPRRQLVSERYLHHGLLRAHNWVPDERRQGGMCGIAGWLSFRHTVDGGDTAALERMTNTVVCRGPDSFGFWSDGYVAFGHRRLAIVDLAGGTQPMIVKTSVGDVALTYCGEVYNFKELRADLISLNHRFNTTSDTEVILRGYLEWGDKIAERLNGMYAFALWDGRRQKLLMVRDRLGIKPIYYYPTSDGVLFGSEPKVILANPSIKPTIDSDGLRQLFSPFKRSGGAMWAGMKELEPGSAITVDRDGISVRVYWALEAAPHNDDLSTTIAVIRDLLADSVARQLVADVPSCVLLSGGLDSSAIAALAARSLGGTGRSVRSFAIDLIAPNGKFTPDPLRETPDKPFAHDVARHIGSTHTDVAFDAKSVAQPEVRRATVGARDSPGCGDMDQSLYLLFRSIRKHATVALSGESADEIFGGYRQFHEPSALQKATFPWISDPPHHGRTEPTMIVASLARALHMQEYTKDAYSTAIAAVPRLDGEDPQERRMREVCHLHLTHFLPLLLDRKDRMSMASGLEVRVPFCDHRLVEYVFNTPWRMKSFDGREKSLLRAAVQPLLPPTVLLRKKSVYPCIHDLNYISAIRDQTTDILAERASPVFDLFDRRLVADAVKLDLNRVKASHRLMFERVLEASAWLELRRPTFQIG
jgi:asparagine synthase (glutamine-hydrolysing)